MQSLIVEPVYLQWHYTSALVWDGLLALGIELEDKAYSSFGANAFEFVFDNQDYLARLNNEGYVIDGLERFGRFKGLWDNGAQAAALINVYQHDPRPEYLEYLKQVAEFFFQYDIDPKQKSRKRNIDQIYTQGVFMARMGELSSDNMYFDYCVEKVLETDSLFFDPATGLYDQIYYPELKTTNYIKWLRGIGWSAMAFVNILDCLPEDHPGYEKVLNIYRKQIAGISAYQSKTGLWKHLVNHPDSYEETSGSVYIVYAIARGINEGLLDPIYRDVAMAGWQGIVSRRQANGDIAGSTSGVSSSTSPAYFLNYPTVNNGDHLFGPLFLAGTEMIKLISKYSKPVPKDWDLIK
ncbi:glycoside hydrolase family 88 protein [Bacteroidota bacterium]